jgi:hypothetical protein
MCLGIYFPKKVREKEKVQTRKKMPSTMKITIGEERCGDKYKKEKLQTKIKRQNPDWTRKE